MTDDAKPPPDYSEMIKERFSPDAARERYREQDEAMLTHLRELHPDLTEGADDER
jgi:hypothetical protein